MDVDIGTHIEQIKQQKDKILQYLLEIKYLDVVLLFFIVLVFCIYCAYYWKRTHLNCEKEKDDDAKILCESKTYVNSMVTKHPFLIAYKLGFIFMKSIVIGGLVGTTLREMLSGAAILSSIDSMILLT